MACVKNDGVLESRWNGFECSQLCGLGVFSLRCTAASPINGPAPYITTNQKDDGDDGSLDGVEDIVDEALFHFKTLVLLPKLRIDKAGDRVLLLLVCFLHECLRSIQTAHRAEASHALSELRYSYARRVAQSEQPGLQHLLRVSGTTGEKKEVEAYLVQLFTEASLRLADKVFLFPSTDGMGSKWWLLFGRRSFLT